MHHANVFTTVFRLDSYPQNTVWNEHGAWKDGDGAGDQKTPKGGYQSKCKEILFLVIDNYGQLINMNVC